MASRQVIRQAARLLQHGGVIAYPTEAVFGLGCDPENALAVGRILTLKRRSFRCGLIVVAAHIDQLRELLAPMPPLVEARLQASWPGPQTWLAPAARHCPAWLTGEHETLAVRVSAHPVVQALCKDADMAIVSTSANRSGRPPAKTALACRTRFGNEIDLVVPGNTGRQERPTSIRDALTGETIRAA